LRQRSSRDRASTHLAAPDGLILKPAPLPARWRTKIGVSRAFGDKWLAAQSSPALLVPSTISPDEWNVLVNPLHRQFSLKWVMRGPVASDAASVLVS
jgi:RES domain-containing protein